MYIKYFICKKKRKERSGFQEPLDKNMDGSAGQVHDLRREIKVGRARHWIKMAGEEGSYNNIRGRVDIH